MTISGAYGRDYKSKKGILADINGGKDFVVRDMFIGGGNYINMEEFDKSGVKIVYVRYKRDTQVAVLTRKRAGQPFK